MLFSELFYRINTKLGDNASADDVKDMIVEETMHLMHFTDEELDKLYNGYAANYNLAN